MEGEAELIAHCHSASGKCQNETTRVITILQQLSDKLTACFFTVLENHSHSFPLPGISLVVTLDESTRDADADQKHAEQNQKRDYPQQMTLRSRSRAMPLGVPRNLKIVRRSEHRTPPFRYPQETITSIDFGFVFSDLGKCTFKTPSLYSAFTLLPSASSGRVKLRIKLP